MSGLRQLIGRLNRYYTRSIVVGIRIFYRRNYQELYSALNKKYGPVEVNPEFEKAWKRKWSKLQKNPDVKQFRLFSRYIGPNTDIVPEDISAGIIHPLLNPIEYRAYCKDKNTFEVLLPKEYLPKALIRSIRGAFYSADYTPILLDSNSLKSITSNSQKVFLKPTVDTSSGKGTYCFIRNNQGNLKSMDSTSELTVDFLQQYQKYNPDFILQEGLSQSSYISQFNPTSINTIRIATYRSVKDNKTNVMQIIMRIGKNGAFVDNAHAGGVFIGINHDGSLGKYACDQFGNTYDSFNGIDFANNQFVIPDFDKVLDFARSIGDKVIHHRLLAQDICIAADGTPRLVEYNIGAFAPWLFQFTVGPAFGEKTDEIIEYCAAHMQALRKVNVEPF